MLVLLLLCTALPLHAGEPRLLPYKGRLLSPTGKAIKGPVDLEIMFFGSEDGDDRRAKTPFLMKQVVLTDGVFEVRIAVDDAELEALFKGGAAFLQVTDKTHGQVYRRSKYVRPADTMNAVAEVMTTPGAVISTAAPTSGAGFGVRAAAASACLATPVIGAKFVAEAGDLGTSCGKVCAAAAPAAVCLRGWTLYGSDRYFDYGNECNVTELPAGETASMRLCCCQNTAAPGALFRGAGAIAH